MQDAMYTTELLSELSFLRYNKLIAPRLVLRIRQQIMQGDYDGANISLDRIFDRYQIDRGAAKGFVDNFKDPSDKILFETDQSNLKGDENDESDEKDENIEFKYEFLDSDFNERNQINSKYFQEVKVLKKDIEIAQQQINIFRSRFRAERFESKKKSDALAEKNEEYQSLKSKYDKLTSELQQQRIEDKIPQYVADVSQKLDDDDTLFMGKSQRWSRTGILLSLIAVFIAMYTFKSGIDTLSKNENIGYVTLLFVFFRGFLAIGILSWVAYLCFNMSSSYIHESILRKDRQHALSFGRLFLQIYGDTATKDDAIEVFKDWNRSGDSAFSKRNTSPPNLFKIIDVLKKSDSNAKSEVE
jgi:hypothetical protein